MRITTHPIIRSLAVALVLAGGLAPAAAAQQDLRSPDTREAAQRALQDFRSPDARDSSEGRGMDKAPIVEFVEVQEPNGFDWADAWLGAAAGIGLVLIGAGTAMTVARMRRRAVGPARA
jgi:hypothetical protein